MKKIAGALMMLLAMASTSISTKAEVNNEAMQQISTDIEVSMDNEMRSQRTTVIVIQTGDDIIVIIINQ
ncbi:MAG: hypothetical protein MJZ13_08675 [Bacteroidales bacterium]|nr:hypothetical protein [Bacteroidales bacterium]